MLSLTHVQYAAALRKLNPPHAGDLEGRVTNKSKEIFTVLSDLFLKIRTFFTGHSSAPKMQETMAIKASVKQAEEGPKVVPAPTSPTSNPVFNFFQLMAFQQILRNLPPETAILVTQAINHLSIQSINWDSASRTGNLGVRLQDDIEGKFSIQLPNQPIAGSSPQPADVHSFILNNLREAKIDESLLKVLLQNLPTSSAKVEWNGTTNNLILKVDLPNAATLQFDLKIPPAKVGKLFPTLLDQVIPAKVQELIPMLSPLLGQNFTLSWDGKSSNIQLAFAQPQELSINEVQLKKVGFLSKLVKGLTKNVKVQLPQAVQVSVNLKTLQLEFDKGVEFTVKKGIISKKIVLNKVAFNPQKKCLDINIQCLGKHKIHVDLTTSQVDKVGVGIRPVNK
ncbi:MAG: hypothetical protein ACRDFB_05435 [Rhabdochlamydiaceae bacterium]